VSIASPSPLEAHSSTLDAPADMPRFCGEPPDGLPRDDAPAVNGAPPTAAQGIALDAVLAPDALSTGILFVLAATIVQRLVGMVRSVLFCDLMSEEEVGLFSLGFSSLVLLAPFAVLGIPGSFGRYVEYYRQRKSLGAYLRRTITVSLALGASLSLLIVLFSPIAAVVLFNDANQAQLAMFTGASLFFVVTFNLLNELATALRKTRRASWMQFVSSIAFAAAGLLLLWLFGGHAEYALLGYAAACIAATLVAWPVIRAVWAIQDDAAEDLSHRQMWGKLLPYTAWFWAFNLLSNVFDISDRYLILWWSKASAAQAQALVGQLHSARVFPVLVVGLATMIGGILLPHLSHDWERGARERVAAHLRFALKLVSLVFGLISASIIFAAPLIFHVVWKGRYDQGLSLLPITCAMCVWQCLTIMAQQYLWCTERARLACIPIVVGLVVSLGLNAVLLPAFGIEGAAVSSAIANLAALGASLTLAHLLGMRCDSRIVIFSLWPAVLSLGLWHPLIPLAATLIGGAGLLFFLEPREQAILRERVDAFRRRLGRSPPSDLDHRN
jgi:PST family polysaccharide transporter